MHEWNEEGPLYFSADQVRRSAYRDKLLALLGTHEAPEVEQRAKDRTPSAERQAIPPTWKHTVTVFTSN